MPRRNVIPLRPKAMRPGELPVSLERLGAAYQDLDDLRRCLEPIIRDPRGPQLDWKVACTALRLRLPAAWQSLADLAEIRAGRWPQPAWAVRLRAARDEAERRLLDVSTSMNSLVHGQTSTMHAAVSFSADSTKLAGAVGNLCDLISSHYPEAIGDS